MIAKVRADVFERDGYCKLAAEDTIWYAGDSNIVKCEGPSHLVHIPPHTRAHTRGLPPEQRHNTQICLCGCRKHHDHIDGRQQPRIVVRCLTPDGTDGPIEVRVK